MFEENKKEDLKRKHSHSSHKLVELGIWICILVLLFMAIVHFTQNGMASKMIFSKDSFVKGDLIEAKNETLEMDELDCVEMQLVNADVEIKLVESDTIQVIEFTNDKNKNDLFEMRQQGDSLVISRKGGNSNLFSWGNTAYHYVEVYLPIEYKEKLVVMTTSGNIQMKEKVELEKLELGTTSGNIDVGQITAESVISTTSGTINVEVLNGEQIEMGSTSGNITVNEGRGDFDIGCTSGRIELGDIRGETHQIETTSGNIMIHTIEGECDLSSSSGKIELDELLGDEDSQIQTTSGNVSVGVARGIGEIDTSSGSVKIEEVLLNGDLQIETTSGNVSLALNKKSGAEVEISTHSGDIKGNADIKIEGHRENRATAQIGSEAEYEVTIETSSGDIHLDEK